MRVGGKMKNISHVSYDFFFTFLPAGTDEGHLAAEKRTYTLKKHALRTKELYILYSFCCPSHLALYHLSRIKSQLINRIQHSKKKHTHTRLMLSSSILSTL